MYAFKTNKFRRVKHENATLNKYKLIAKNYFRCQTVALSRILHLSFPKHVSLLD